MMLHISAQQFPAEKQHEGEDLYAILSTKCDVENVLRCRLYGRASKRWTHCTVSHAAIPSLSSSSSVNDFVAMDNAEDEDDALSVLLRQLAFHCTENPQQHTLTKDAHSSMPFSMGDSSQLARSSPELKRVHSSSVRGLTIGGEKEKMLVFSKNRTAADECLHTFSRPYSSGISDVLSAQETTSQTGTETQSEETTCGEHHYSIQFVRDSLDDAITTLHTPRSDGSSDDELVDMTDFDQVLLDLGHILTDSSYHRTHTPLSLLEEIPNTFPFFSPTTTSSAPGQLQLQRPESPSSSNHLFDHVDCTLQNMESMIDLVLNREKSLDDMIRQKDEEIRRQVQAQQDMSLLIHQLHTELDKANGDSDVLNSKVHSLESAVADFVDRETVVSSKVVLLQDLVQSKSDELLDMKQAHDILQQELNSTRLQVQTYTTEKEAYQDQNQRTQKQLYALQNLVEQKSAELETLGMTVDKLNDQICQECLRNKEACNHIDSLEKTIQNLRQSADVREEEERKTLSRLLTLEELIHTKDAEIYSLKATLSALSLQKEEYDAQNQKKEWELLEKLHTAETSYENTLSRVHFLENCVHKDEMILKLESLVHAPTPLNDSVIKKDSDRCKKRDMDTDVSSCAVLQSAVGQSNATGAESLDLSRDGVWSHTLSDSFNELSPETDQVEVESLSPSLNSATKDGKEDSFIEKIQTLSNVVDLDSSSTVTVVNNTQVERKCNDSDALLIDAEHVIQTLEKKIVSLEKTVLAYKMQQLENTDLLSDEADLMRYWNETSQDVFVESDITASNSPLITRQRYDGMVYPSSLSATSDLIPFNESLASNNLQLMSKNRLSVKEKMSDDYYLRLSALETDNRYKDQMIEILCEQIYGLKACLEELLESDRLCENEYKIKWIEAEEKCRMLLNERDALLDETLKLAMNEHAFSHRRNMEQNELP